MKQDQLVNWKDNWLAKIHNKNYVKIKFLFVGPKCLFV